jgi:hypothetical protein
MLHDLKALNMGIAGVKPRQAGYREELLDPPDLASMTAAACSMF